VVGVRSVYVPCPSLWREVEATVTDCVALLKSICGYQTWRRAHPDAPDILVELQARLEAVYGGPDAPVTIVYPCFLLLAVPRP
jgi:hypothetical protein